MPQVAMRAAWLRHPALNFIVESWLKHRRSPFVSLKPKLTAVRDIHSQIMVGEYKTCAARMFHSVHDSHFLYVCGKAFALRSANLDALAPMHCLFWAQNLIMGIGQPNDGPDSLDSNDHFDNSNPFRHGK